MIHFERLQNNLINLGDGLMIHDFRLQNTLINHRDGLMIHFFLNTKHLDIQSELPNKLKTNSNSFEEDS